MMRTLIAAGLAVAVTPLSAQSSRAVQPGARVRVSAPALGKEKLVAGVLSMRNDSLVVQVAGRTDSVALALNDLRSLERSKGMRRQFWRTFLLGTSAGVALGGAIGYMLPAEEEPSRLCYDSRDRKRVIPCRPHAVRDGNVQLGMAVVGGVGEIVGLVVGLKRRVERWERIEQSDWTSRVSLVPAASRGLAVRVSF